MTNNTATSENQPGMEFIENEFDEAETEVMKAGAKRRGMSVNQYLSFLGFISHARSQIPYEIRGRIENAEFKVCQAVADCGRIQLVIDKGDDGYDEFVKVINKIETQGFFSFYGDVTNADGEEQCGLILTPLPDERRTSHVPNLRRPSEDV